MFLFQWQIKFEDFDLDNILVDEKSYQNTLVYIIWYKSLIIAKPLCIRFDKIDGFIRVYDGTRYLELENIILFITGLNILQGKKSSITYVISYNYAKIKVDLYDSLPLEKILNKSAWNKDKVS